MKTKWLPNISGCRAERAWTATRSPPHIYGKLEIQLICGNQSRTRSSSAEGGYSAGNHTRLNERLELLRPLALGHLIWSGVRNVGLGKVVRFGSHRNPALINIARNATVPNFDGYGAFI
jgi:hypothetical protein